MAVFKNMQPSQLVGEHICNRYLSSGPVYAPFLKVIASEARTTITGSDSACIPDSDY